MAVVGRDRPRPRPRYRARSASGERVRGLASFPGVLKTNPYQRLLYDGMASHGIRVVSTARLEVGWLWRARNGVEILHFHWPQSYWQHRRGIVALRPILCYVKLALFAFRLLVARALGYRVVWTIHQVYPHEVTSPRLDRLGARVLARLSHVRIAHDASTRQSALDELGRAAEDTAIVPHGSYVGVYPDGRPRAAVRDALGITRDAVVFLCFGHLRAYKDVEFLLDAFRAADLPDAVLIIAGSVGDDGAAAEVRRAAEKDGRIRPLLSFVPDDRVAELFAAADVGIVARNDGGTSASILLAISLGRPVIAAGRDAYRALLGDEEAGWLFEPGDRAAMTRALERAGGVEPRVREEKGRAALRRAERLRWPAIAARTAALIHGGAPAAN
jgi:beta-1,4-mannosyltransferase